MQYPLTGGIAMILNEAYGKTTLTLQQHQY